MAKSRARVRLLTFQRALARAEAAGLTVVGEDVRDWDHAPIFRVPSASEPGRIHNVVWVARDEQGDGGSLICDCEGAWHGWHCSHRATVRAYLMSQHKQPA
jgi:hypothetical protein